MHDPGHVSWVGCVLYGSCATAHNGRLGCRLSRSWFVRRVESFDRGIVSKEAFRPRFFHGGFFSSRCGGMYIFWIPVGRPMGCPMGISWSHGTSHRISSPMDHPMGRPMGQKQNMGRLTSYAVRCGAVRCFNEPNRRFLPTRTAPQEKITARKLNSFDRGIVTKQAIISRACWLRYFLAARCGSVRFYRTAPHRMSLPLTKPHRTAS